MKQRNLLIGGLVLLLAGMIAGGSWYFHTRNSDGKPPQEGAETAGSGEAGEKTARERQLEKMKKRETDMEPSDITNRYQETIGESMEGEPYQGYFCYADDVLVYEKPGDEVIFVAAEDGREVRNYGKRTALCREGRTILARTIDPEGRLCQLEEDVSGRIYLVSFAQEERTETELDFSDSSLNRDFSECVLMTDGIGIYVRGKNKMWEPGAEERNWNTLFVFSRQGELLYEDEIWDMELQEAGTVVLMRHMPSGGISIENIAVTGQMAEVAESRMTTALRLPRYWGHDRSTGQWYFMEAERIEALDMERLNRDKQVTVLDYNGETSIQCIKSTTEEDIYENGMKFLDAQAENGKFYLMFGTDQDGKREYRMYSYQEADETEKETTLTITLPYPIYFIRQAVGMYERKYPESHIKIESYYDTYQDFKAFFNTYGEQMTTKIIAGDFGDIICSSQGLRQSEILWTDAYLDLSEMVEGLEYREDLNQGALQGLTINGALRALPVGVDLYYYGINEKLAAEEGITDLEHITWGQLLDIALGWKAEGAEGKSLFGSGFSGTEDLLSFLISNNARDLINIPEKTFDLRQEWFLDLMRKWKEVYDSGYLYSYGMAEMTRERNWEDTKFINGFEKGSLLQAYARRNLQFDWEDVDLLSESEQFFRYNAKHDCEQTFLGGIYGEKSRNFNSLASMLFSVNARTEHKEEALRFMAFLMSEEVQSLKSVTGIPMNRKADEKNWQAVAEEAEKGIEGVTPEQVETYHQKLAAVSEEIDELYPNHYYRYIDQAMNEYVMGKLSLEEAVAKAEENLRVALNE